MAVLPMDARLGQVIAARAPLPTEQPRPPRRPPCCRPSLSPCPCPCLAERRRWARCETTPDLVKLGQIRPTPGRIRSMSVNTGASLVESFSGQTLSKSRHCWLESGRVRPLSAPFRRQEARRWPKFGIVRTDSKEYLTEGLTCTQKSHPGRVFFVSTDQPATR